MSKEIGQGSVWPKSKVVRESGEIHWELVTLRGVGNFHPIPRWLVRRYSACSIPDPWLKGNSFSWECYLPGEKQQQRQPPPKKPHKTKSKSRTSQNYIQTTKNPEYIRKPRLQGSLNPMHKRNNNHENRIETVDWSSVSLMSAEILDDMTTVKQEWVGEK